MIPDLNMEGSFTSPSNLDSEGQAKVKALLAALSPQVDRMLVTNGEEGCTEQTCIRWLRARKWDVKLAAKHLTEHAKWRQEFMSAFPGHKHVPTRALKLELARDMVYMVGSDIKHHPAVLVLGGKHMPQEVERTKRFISYTLDACCHWGHLELAKKQQQAQLEGVQLERNFYDGKVVGIFDLSDFGYANADLSALKAVFDLLQNHYIERLYRMYLYCAPTIFYGLYKVVSPLIDPKSKEKLQFVEKANAQKYLTELFKPESLPSSFGGSFQPIPIQDVWDIIEQQNLELKGPE